MNWTSSVRRNAVAAFVAVAVFAPAFYMLLDRGQPYEWLEGKLHPAEPNPGDWLEVEWVVKINRVCPGTVHRQISLKDGTIINYDPVPAIRREQISKDVDGHKLFRQFLLSARAVPGPAKYRSYTCYVCNPLQNWWPICVWTPDIAFVVQGKDNQPEKPPASR